MSWLCFPYVSAEDANLTNVSYVIVNYQNPYGAPLDYIPSIEQGETVYVNDTIDISRVAGWPGPDGEYRMAWYGKWFSTTSPEDIDPLYILKLPGKARSGKVATQYKYYIDPDIFADRTGWWYQFYSNTSTRVGTESSGNLRAFYVSSNPRSITQQNNTTTMYGSGTYTEKVEPVQPLMPEKHITDLLVARGDKPDINVSNQRAWVFGRVDGLYGIERNITADDIWTLEPGEYNVVLQSPGQNTIYDVTLSGNYLIPGLYGKQPIDISSTKQNAYVMQEKFKGMVKDTDDRISELRMEVQEPEITLEQIDEIYLNGITVLDIRGYTNAAKGTEITVTLDEGKSFKSYIAERTKTTEAVRTDPGAMSYYRVYLPIDYDTLSAANALNHTIAARTAIGGVVYKDFWISVLPADSFKPNATIKYIENRNPFVPLPTPIVQTVEKEVTKVVVEYRNVTVIEKEEFDYAKFIYTGIPIFFGILGAVLLIGWAAVTVWIAKRRYDSEHGEDKL